MRHDPEGAWVAKEGGRISGVAISLVRERVWVLSLFAVDAAYRSTGVGGRLLGRALAYGKGCEGAMIASSQHPAAMRSYARAGFDLQPTLSASGPQRTEVAGHLRRGVQGADHVVEQPEFPGGGSLDCLHR